MSQIDCFLKELFAIVLAGISIYIYTNEVGILGDVAFRYNVIYTPSTVLLVYLLAVDTGFLAKLLSISIFQWLARISSFCYLMHQMIIWYLPLVINKVSINS